MQPGESRFSLGAVVAGAVGVIVGMLLWGLLLGALDFLWELAGRNRQLLGLAGVGLAYFLGSGWAALRAGQRGWLHGLATGLLALGPHWLFARSWTGAMVAGGLLAGIGLLCSLLGGVVGVQARRP